MEERWKLADSILLMRRFWTILTAALGLFASLVCIASGLAIDLPFLVTRESDDAGAYQDAYDDIAAGQQWLYQILDDLAAEAATVNEALSLGVDTISVSRNTLASPFASGADTQDVVEAARVSLGQLEAGAARLDDVQAKMTEFAADLDELRPSARNAFQLEEEPAEQGLWDRWVALLRSVGEGPARIVLLVVVNLALFSGVFVFLRLLILRRRRPH